MLLRRYLVVFVGVFGVTASNHAQQAVSSINQARLFSVPAPPQFSTANATENDSESSNANDDDSFGTQLILKNQEHPRAFTFFGDTSVIYTTNVDLRPDNTRADAFVMTDFGTAWRRNFARTFAADVSLGAAIYRYDRASELDFNRLFVGTGVTWVVPHARGLIAYVRYDFTELVNKHGDELLQDHAFTIGAQRTFSFGRPQFFTLGIAAVGGISTPESQEREQASVFGAYHLQFSRLVGADLIYRYAAQFYTEGGRIDHNQSISFVIGCSPQRWLRLDALLGFGRNDSNREAFGYDAVNVSGTVRANIRF